MQGLFDDPPLDEVQAHLPAFEASLEDGLQCFLVGGDERRRAGGRRGVIGRVARRVTSCPTPTWPRSLASTASP